MSIYGTLSNSDGENPLDLQTLLHSKSELTVIASDAVTGRAKLFHKTDMLPDDYRILMASACVPGVNQPIQIGSSLYYDGALADPVPIQKAFDDGCERVVLILTKPVGEIRTSGKDMLLTQKIQRKFPLAAENMRLRADRYNEGVRLAQEYVRVELQIRTVAMDFWASLEHDIKYKKDVQDCDSIAAELKACADTIADTDRRMMELRDNISSLPQKSRKQLPKTNTDFMKRN